MSTVYGTSPVNRIRRTNAELDLIDSKIIEVLEEEHPATVRSVFYRVMSMGVVPKTENGYKLVQRQLLKLRRNERVPYGWISDGTRYTIHRRAHGSASDAIMTAAALYRRQIWSTQAERPEIYIEKDALTAVISPVTGRWDVPLGVQRGFASETYAYEVAEALPRDQHTFMYQLGDHDPSGLDAWRSWEAKVRRFAPDATVTFKRLAVTPEQIEAMQLPTRPTKQSDSRAAKFVGGSVEVDAIAPSVLRSIVEQAILDHLDIPAWEALQEAERKERNQLFNLARELESGTTEGGAL